MLSSFGSCLCLYPVAAGAEGIVFTGRACIRHETRLGGAVNSKILLFLNGSRRNLGCRSGAFHCHRSSAFLCCFNLSFTKLSTLVSVSRSGRVVFNSRLAVSRVI